MIFLTVWLATAFAIVFTIEVVAAEFTAVAFKVNPRIVRFLSDLVRRFRRLLVVEFAGRCHVGGYRRPRSGVDFCRRLDVELNSLPVHHFEEGPSPPGRVVAAAQSALKADKVELGLTVGITVKAFDIGQDALEPRWHRVVG